MSKWDDPDLISATRRSVFGDGGWHSVTTVDSSDWVELEEGKYEVLADGGNVIFQPDLREPKTIKLNLNSNPEYGAIKLAEGRTVDLTLSRRTIIRVEPAANAWCTFIRRAPYDV